MAQYARRSDPKGRGAFPAGRRNLAGARSITVLDAASGKRYYAGEVDPYLVPLSTVTLAGSGTTTRALRFYSRGGLLIRSMRATSTGPFSIGVFDDKSQHSWQGRQMLGSLVCGDGGHPYELPVPALIRPGNALVLSFADLSAAPNAIDLTFDCCRLDPSVVNATILRLLEREMPFFHSAAVVLPAAVGGRSLPVNLIAPTEVSVDFEFWDLLQHDPTILVDDWYAEFQNTGDATLWGAGPTLASSIFGDAQFPGRLCSSIVVPGNETVQIIGTNKTATARTVEVVLAGTKAWTS